MNNLKLIIFFLLLHIFVVECVNSHFHDTDKSEQDNPYATKNTYMDAILGYIFYIIIITIQIPLVII